MRLRLELRAVLSLLCGLSLDAGAAEADLAACHRLGELYFTVQERVLYRHSPETIAQSLSKGDPTVAAVVRKVATDLTESKPVWIIPFVAMRGETCLAEAGIKPGIERLNECYTEVFQSRMVFDLKAAGRQASEVKEVASVIATRLKPENTERFRSNLSNLVDAAYATTSDRLTFMRGRFSQCVSGR